MCLVKHQKSWDWKTLKMGQKYKYLKRFSLSSKKSNPNWQEDGQGNFLPKEESEKIPGFADRYSIGWDWISPRSVEKLPVFNVGNRRRNWRFYLMDFLSLDGQSVKWLLNPFWKLIIESYQPRSWWARKSPEFWRNKVSGKSSGTFSGRILNSSYAFHCDWRWTIVGLRSLQIILLVLNGFCLFWAWVSIQRNWVNFLAQELRLLKAKTVQLKIDLMGWFDLNHLNRLKKLTFVHRI